MMKNLVVLVADKNSQFVLQGLLSRHHSFRIKALKYDIFIHPQRDPGVYHGAGNFLQAFQTQYEKALVFLDREGSGQEHKEANQIANELKANLEQSGWGDRVAVIVFDPELEIWAWANSPHLATNLGWDSLETLNDFIRQLGFWQLGSLKPSRPKESIEAALKEKRIPRSSAIYKKIASAVSFRDCQEASFLKFKRILINWFSNGE